MTAKSTRNCSNLLDGHCTDNAAVALPNGAAGQEDFDGAASVQFACDMQVVGDDQKAGMSRKRFATSSVVVPILMNNDELSGISRAAVSPINFFWSCATSCRAS